MSGSYGAPIVGMTLLSADIPLPRPHVGHAKSLILSGGNPEPSPQADLADISNSKTHRWIRSRWFPRRDHT